MRISFFLLVLLTFPAATYADDISRNPSISISGEKLYLAYVESNPDGVLNEYIRKDETLENWKVLLAVRYIRSAKSVDEVVTRWKSYIEKARSPGKKMKEAVESAPTDRRFSLAMRPPGDAYLETDELRFVPGPEGKGVIYYQAAVRINPTNKADILQGLQKQAAFSGALVSLTLPAVEQMPNQPPRPVRQ